MIPFLAPLLLKFPLLGRLPWKLIGIGAAVLAVGVVYVKHRNDLIEAGRAEVRALWNADTADRDKATAEAIAKAEADKAAALARNQEIERLTDEKLAAIDRADGLGRMLRETSDRLRRVSAAQATGQLGIAVSTGIAARASEAAEDLERQWDAYDRSCQRDAVRFQALIDQIKPQL